MYANNGDPSSVMYGECLNQSNFAVTDTQQPKTDELIENALINNIAIDKPLTRREIQILRSILAGKTNKQIARMLCRSQRTVEYHRNRLMRKLNTHSMAELIKKAITMGIV